MEAYLGEVRQFAGPYAPEGWAICDGSLLSINEHTDLFNLIGDKFGGGNSKFALPDLRGRAVICRGQGVGLQNYTFGNNGGHEKVTLTNANLPVHRHKFLVSPKPANSKVPGPKMLLAVPVEAGIGPGANPNVITFLPNNPTDTTQKILPMSAATLSPSGNSMPSAHENRMPYVTINFIICISGTYPRFS